MGKEIEMSEKIGFGLLVVVLIVLTLALIWLLFVMLPSQIYFGSICAERGFAEAIVALPSSNYAWCTTLRDGTDIVVNVAELLK